MKRLLRINCLASAILITTACNAFVLTNGTQNDFIVSVAIEGDSSVKTLASNESFYRSESLEIPYPYAIIFPGQQVVVYLQDIKYSQNIAVLAFPTILGASIKTHDEICVFPDGHGGFKLVHVNTPYQA